MSMLKGLFLLALLLPQSQAAKEPNFCDVDDHGTATPGCTITNGTYGCPGETQFLKRRFSGFCCCNCHLNFCTHKGKALAIKCHRCPKRPLPHTPRTTQNLSHPTSLPVKPTTMPPVGNGDWKTAFILLCVAVAIGLLAWLIWVYRARLISCIRRYCRSKKDEGTNDIQGNGHVEGSHGDGETEGRLLPDPNADGTFQTASDIANQHNGHVGGHQGEDVEAAEGERIPLTSMDIPRPVNSANGDLLLDSNADNTSQTSSDTGGELETGV